MVTRLKVSFQRPVKMLCTDWVAPSQTLWVSFAWGLLFLFQSSVPQTFSGNYGFNNFETSLVQPGLFWYGWANYSHVLWVVPVFGVGFIGLGIHSIYLAVDYLTDSYEKYAPSALSDAPFRRDTFGAFLPLASPAL